MFATRAPRDTIHHMDLDLKSLADKNIVILDGIGPWAIENKCFDPEVAADIWYRYSAVVFYQECLKNNIQLITPDIYFRLPEKPKKAIYLRESTVGKNYTKTFLREGVPLAVIVGFETPLYSPVFFWTLPWQTKRFGHSFMWEGARAWTSRRSKFHLFLGHHMYPLDITVESNFPKKKYLALVNTNHRINRYKRWLVNVMQAVQPVPTFVNKEMYVERLNAVKYFSHDPEFDLYGNWWDKPVRYTKGEFAPYIEKSYRGHIDDKYETLKGYKFSICFENAIWAGNITEKIIDSLFAGCVPVYWGAPDIADFIPENCFIDFRKFNCDYPTLEKYLKGMDERTYEQYIANINAFIRSEAAYNMSGRKYMKDLIDVFKTYF